MGSNALTKLQSENLWKLRTAIINIIISSISLLFATKKSFFVRFSRANTQQVLPVQTGLYWYDE